MRRRTKKRKSDHPVKGDCQVCALCQEKPDKEIYGKLFIDESSGFTVHQYCMFFASGLPQDGKDDQGFDGYFIKDIKYEISRSKRLKCSYCKRGGASIGCCKRKCSQQFHYRCGKSHGALFQFFGHFNSFCVNHRPTQNVSLSESLNQTCPICLSDLDWNTSLCNVPISTPCCKNSWFHHECLQHQATSSGLHYFRCPVCNNTDKFQEEMKRMGIFIPEQDASWEQGDAFADLLFRYNHCDAPMCICPSGRDHSESSGKWRIRLCDSCGQSGTHLKCQHSKRFPVTWYCENCVRTSSHLNSPQHPVGDHSAGTEESDSESSCNEDVEVHVCSDSEDDKPLITLKQDVQTAEAPNQCTSTSSTGHTAAGTSPQPKRLKLSPQPEAAEAETDCSKENQSTQSGGCTSQSRHTFDLFDSASMTSSLLLAVSDIFNKAVRKLGMSPKEEMAKKDEEIKLHSHGRSNAEPILIGDTDSDCSSEDIVDLLKAEDFESQQSDSNKMDEGVRNDEVKCSEDFVKEESRCFHNNNKDVTGMGDSVKISRDLSGKRDTKLAKSGSCSRSNESDDDDDACFITKVVKRPCPLGNDKFGNCFLRCCKPLGYCNRCSLLQSNFCACVNHSDGCTSSSKGQDRVSESSVQKIPSHGGQCKTEEVEIDSMEKSLLDGAAMQPHSCNTSVELCSVGTNTSPLLPSPRNNKLSRGTEKMHLSPRRPAVSSRVGGKRSLRSKKTGSYLERSLKRFCSLREHNMNITHKCAR